MKAIVIDDFRLARLELISLFNKHKDIDLIGECDNGNDALALINQLKPDVVFTDINMPGMSVFEFLEKIDENIQVIFTTAYADYAPKTFVFNTVDYLLKPISQERFDIAAEKTRKRLELLHLRALKVDPFSMESKIMVKTSSGYELKQLADIVRFEAKENDTLIYFSDFNAEMSRPLCQIEKRLPEANFFRISRQAIVNIHFVKSIVESDSGTGQFVVLNDGNQVAITRRQFLKIRDLLII